MGKFRRVPVGIVGASGYGGVQLVRLLMDHPEVELVYLGDDSSAGKTFSDLYPHLAHAVNLPIEAIEPEIIAQRCEVVFLALPNGLACQIVPKLLEKECKVLDLSADYRFSDLRTYTDWYGIQRSDRTTAATAIYGLPELYRDRIAEAQLIGCPGCYPTASLPSTFAPFEARLNRPRNSYYRCQVWYIWQRTAS